MHPLVASGENPKAFLGGGLAVFFSHDFVYGVQSNMC